MRVFGIGVVVTLAAGLALAGPVELHKRAIDQASWKALSLHAGYAQAAYCKQNDAPLSGTASRPIACADATGCGQALGKEIILAFDGGVSVFAPTGYVAIDRNLKEVVVAFRGTDVTSINNIITDIALSAQQAAPELCPDCRVSVGAAQSINLVQNNITSTVLGALKKSENAGYRVSFVGHSLGAALATLSAGIFRVANPSIKGVSMYSYGSPRLLNPAAASFITNQGNNFRVTHSRDVVPRSVPRSLLGSEFEHIAPEFFITSPNLPQPASVVNFLPAGPADLETLNGNAGPAGDFKLGTNLLAEHLRYFTKIGLCDNPKLADKIAKRE